MSSLCIAKGTHIFTATESESWRSTESLGPGHSRQKKHPQVECVLLHEKDTNTYCWKGGKYFQVRLISLRGVSILLKQKYTHTWKFVSFKPGFLFTALTQIWQGISFGLMPFTSCVNFSMPANLSFQLELSNCPRTSAVSRSVAFSRNSSSCRIWYNLLYEKRGHWI